MLIIGTCFLLLFHLTISSDVVELNSKLFKKDVLKGDNTYFVMFYTKRCGACHQMQPDLEKLATAMKPAGIKVGRVDLDREPGLSRTYNCYSIPKLLLFLPPNGKYLEYQSYRTAKEMGSFILDNQRGDKQVFIAQKEEKLASLFNETGLLPRIVLMSHKTSVPPMLKTLCYKHRKKIMCWFMAEKNPVLKSFLKQIATFPGHEDDETNPKKIDYPSLLAYDRMQPEGEQVVRYEGKKLDYENLNKFFNKIEKARENVSSTQDNTDDDRVDDEKGKKEKKKKGKADETNTEKEKDTEDEERKEKKQKKEKEKEKKKKEKEKKQEYETGSDEDEKEEPEKEAKSKKESKANKQQTEIISLSQSAYEGKCLKTTKLCVVFLLSDGKEGTVRESLHTQQVSIITEIVRQMYSKNDYTYFWSSPSLLSSSLSFSSLSSYFTKIISSSPSSALSPSPSSPPAILAINPHKSKVSTWIVESPLNEETTTSNDGSGANNAEEEDKKDSDDDIEDDEPKEDPYVESVLNMWTYISVYMDRLIGGEARFTKESFLEGKKEL